MAKKDKAMSDVEVNEVEAPAAATKGVQYTTVTMDDGRVLDFAGKRKMVKDSIQHENGDVSVRLDFVNGESRTFTVKSDHKLFAKYASHGIEQKLGDETAGLTDVGDMVMAIDELTERLHKGDWGVARKPGAGMAGTSVLARALVEHSGKTMDVIKTFLAGKSQGEKVALRQNSAIAPIVARLEALKAPKKPSGINTEAMLDDLNA